MTQQQLAGRRAPIEALVIAHAKEGFRIYSVNDPHTSYIVSGSYQDPRCTCPEFSGGSQSPASFCQHILAVREQLERTPDEDRDEAEERRAIQAESAGAAPAMSPRGPNGVAEMLIKRSVSPDGRIDSLSVEFSCPVEHVPTGEIQVRAQKILGLQSAIVDRFLNRSPNGNGASASSGASNRDGHASSNGVSVESPAVPARMVSVAGMDGKWGRRLFINVQVNGNVLKLFGNRKELAQAITDAGFEAPKELTEGMRLDLPCRVTTVENGKYTNIDRVFPEEMPAPQLQRRGS